MVHHPQRGLGYADRELPDLDTVELVHVDTREESDVEYILGASACSGVNLTDDLDFKQAQLAVGDDEEIAAATGRVEESQLPQFFLESVQIGAAAAVSTGL